MNIKESIETLEKMADSLEQDDIDIDHALDAYKKALELAKTTAGKLTQAEDTFTVLHREGNEIVAQIQSKSINER